MPQTPAGEPARAVPAPPARETPDQAAASAVPAPAAPPAVPPAGPSRPRPVVTVTGDQPGERPIRMVERALGNPSDRRSAGWHDRVVVVPGGHRPGRPDQMQRDRARARLPIPAGRRVVVLGCTVGAGQTVTALLTGEVLASLRDDQVAVLDLNPGSGSLAQRATAVPSLTDSGPPAPTRLEVVTRETAAAAGQEDDVTKIFELLSARYPITLTDPGAATVPRVLATASQLIMVAPASQDAATALASTREWLEAHGHTELADGAIIVLNGVSRHTMRHVEQAEALARGRCRAIIRVPWDDSLKNPGPERAAPPDQATMAGPAGGGLSQGALNAYTALAGVLVAALADAPEQTASPLMSGAKTGRRSRLSVRYFDDRILLTETHAWAYYRLPTVSYEFTTPQDREALATNITVALAAIRMPDAEVHLRIVHRSYPAAEWATGLDATSDGGPGWPEYLDEMYQHVWAKDFWTKEVYLGVRLGQRGVRAQLSGGVFAQFIGAYRASEEVLGLGDEAVPPPRSPGGPSRPSGSAARWGPAPWPRPRHLRRDRLAVPARAGRVRDRAPAVGGTAPQVGRGGDRVAAGRPGAQRAHAAASRASGR